MTRTPNLQLFIGSIAALLLGISASAAQQTAEPPSDPPAGPTLTKLTPSTEEPAKPLPSAKPKAEPAKDPKATMCVPTTVFVADGAGGYLNMSRNLQSVMTQDGCPVRVVTFEWSHGPGRYLADHFAYRRARQAGADMAATIEHYHRENPDTRIHVVGHSAGVAVALAALESLPPETVDRAFILSPSVTADYDIRPALKSVKDHLYVHYSTRDWFWIGVATRVAGATDRRWGAVSGRIGFRVDANDPDIQKKLVQRNWEPADAVTGNTGGHFGAFEMDYLRAQVVPYMTPDTAKKDNPGATARQGN